MFVSHEITMHFFLISLHKIPILFPLNFVSSLHSTENFTKKLNVQFAIHLIIDFQFSADLFNALIQEDAVILPGSLIVMVLRI